MAKKRTRKFAPESAAPVPPQGSDLAAEGRALIEASNMNTGTNQPGTNRGDGTEGEVPSSLDPSVDPAFTNFGISGLTRYGPISRIYEEFLRELQGPQGMRNYREMADNSAIVGAILFAAQFLCRKVSFKFKPANSTPEARWVADFCGGAIFDDMDTTWPDTLSEILTMLTFGWSAMEFRMKRRVGMGFIDISQRPVDHGIGGIGATVDPSFSPSRFEDGLIGFRSWSLRSQETLFMWEFNEDSEATVMQQMAPPDYRIRRIPLAKTFNFRTQVSKGSPEGRSILRNSWVSYYMAKTIQVFEGIGIERDLAGYPVIQIAKPEIDKGLAVPDIWNPNNPEMVALLSAMKRIVSNVKRDQFEGMVLPWWAEFKLLTTGSRRTMVTNEIIGRHEQRIAMSVLADFIMLGHEAVGSKALASTKISLFTSALSSFMDTIGAVINRRAVPMLLQFNNIPLNLAPTLEHGDVETVNLSELGEFIAKIAGTGFNPLASPEAQRAVLQAAKMPTTGVIDPNETMSGGGVGDNLLGEQTTSAPVDAPGSISGSPSSLTTV